MKRGGLVHNLVYSLFIWQTRWNDIKNLAGVGGFEPPNPGSKDLCLTA